MNSATAAPQSKGSAKIKAVFTGMDDLFRVLEGLPLEVQSGVIYDAVNKAVKPLVRLAKQFAPKKSGALKASITSKAIRGKQKGTAIALMGPSKGRFNGSKRVKKGESKAGSDQPSRYAHLVEYGHQTSKGRVGARPFMRPATAAGLEEVRRQMMLGVSNGLNKALRKFNRQTYG